MENEVKDVRFAQTSPRTIFAVVIGKDDFEYYGASSCRNLEDFDEDLGREYAMRQALGKLYRKLNN